MTTLGPVPASSRQAAIEQIHTLLHPPPSLRTVAQQSAQADLDQHFGAATWQAERLYIGTPGESDGALAYQALVDCLLQRLAAAKPLLLVPGYQVVVQRQREVFVPGGPPLAQLEVLINRCATLLLGAYAQHLQAWWREALPVNMTRWGYVSDDLLALLYESPPPPGFTAQRFASVFPRRLLRPDRPDPQWNLHGDAVRVQALYLSGEPETNDGAQMLPLLVLSHGAQHVLFSPANGLHPLTRLEDVAKWLAAYAPTPGAPTHWFAADVEGDPFDALAASYLAQQLRDIDRIDRSIALAPGQHQALLDYITDARRWFVPRPSALQRSLRNVMPLWLTQAGDADSTAYARLLQAWVLARQDSAGAHFLEGIGSIQQFADNALQACLRRESSAQEVRPGNIRLTFNRVVAAAVPVQGGFIAGEVDPVTVTLTELALENLAGFPSTPSLITLDNAKAPVWLTYNLLKSCVARANVGQAYPDLLKQKLVDDPQETARRLQLFRRQLRVQLPMLALELKIKGEHGLTQQGFKRVHAVLQAKTADRQVDSQAMALWPLAFKATADAAADVIANHFIIGPRRLQTGVHLLYRPLLEPMLLEFASIDALFAAIKAPGPLQDSVLTWIAPRRRAVYAQGGFEEPHVRRFLAGDEFTRYEKPAPAQLAKQISAEGPTSQVFNATAKALVALADRQSVSNTEQRWASLKQAGWLLFGAVLPFARGPWMLGGWLLQLMDSLQQDVQGLGSGDKQVQSAAIMDVLMNLTLILAHQGAPHDPRQQVALEHPLFAPLAQPEVIPGQPVPTQIPTPATFRAAAGWANARATLTDSQQARLRTLSLKVFAEPWPEFLPNAEQSGRWRGLLRDTAHMPAQWQALVRGHLYRVQAEQGRVRVISADGATLGPRLEALGGGRWDFDLRLYLDGGNADSVIQAAQQTALASLPTLEREYLDASQARIRSQAAMEVAGRLMRQASHLSDEQLAQVRERYRTEVQNKVRLSQHELQLLMRLREIKPRPHYEEDLCEVLESLILALQLLDAHAREHMLRINAQVRPLLTLLESESAEEAESDINHQAHTRLQARMGELVVVQESAIEWRTLEINAMHQLRNVPRLGRDKAAALVAQLPARPSNVDLKTLQMTSLWGLSIDAGGPPLEDEFYQGLNQVMNRARCASRSLADLEQLAVTREERIELLKSFSQVYAFTDDRIEFWRAMTPESFDLPYLQKLQALLRGLRQQVEEELAGLLAADAPSTSAPVATGARQKKIIRTRNRDVYVARFKARAQGGGAETAELVDAKDNVIATFTEAADGVWEPVEPPARGPAADPQLGALMNKGQRLLRDVDKAILKVQALAATCTPSSLQALLDEQATSRRWVADSIAGKLRDLDLSRLSVVQQGNARTREGELRAAALRLEAAGVQARVRASKLKLDSVEDVAFLKQLDEVNILRQGARVPLQGKAQDFLQVYTVVDAHSKHPLCYAHFHYERSQGPDDHYTAAHLKSPEQERLGRQAQAEVEAQAFARIRTGQAGRVRQTLEIDRASISRALARHLFFSVD
ncbi:MULTISPECIES: hypothetical protein [Pseudomonas fluorescens group]|uniref:Uncharacterized protein n=1 Tax=Pseudomonas fluorescens TaxID=294 RepID=A0A0D0TAR6_PSEFL|nr:MULTISPECIES: hypothetical protein [Pseudomonas fluorescens group]AZE59546.1 hypothetical protein C4K02_1168 [Pseudomonas synxantha]KIR20701.1 hypothetical protein PFLU3_38460 [Pseudomonas fluorescens]